MKLTFEQIYSKLNTREYVIVHIKDTMEAKLLDAETKIIMDMPEGYLNYDHERYYRKI